MSPPPPPPPPVNQPILNLTPFKCVMTTFASGLLLLFFLLPTCLERSWRPRHPQRGLCKDEISLRHDDRLAEALKLGRGVAEHAQGGGQPARVRYQVEQEEEVLALALHQVLLLVGVQGFDHAASRGKVRWIGRHYLMYSRDQ